MKSYHGLMIARVFLGLAEGGLFPGIAFYITVGYILQLLLKFQTQETMGSSGTVDLKRALEWLYIMLLVSTINPP